MPDGERPISIIGSVSVSGPVALAALRRVAEEALSSRPGAETVDENGAPHVHYLPPDVASELIERIDGAHHDGATRPVASLAAR